MLGRRALAQATPEGHSLHTEGRCTLSFDKYKGELGLISDTLKGICGLQSGGLRVIHPAAPPGSGLIMAPAR